ncbi:MAG: diguanylate cyclase [Nitrospira sp.]|nr:diguanylate cyclase [Nitrospira sp.]
MDIIADYKKILIVEDSMTQAVRLTYILEKEGYEVTVAASGEDAIEALLKVRPSIIISDIVMPGISGYELCSRIKAEKKYSDIPVILLTSLSDPGDVLRGLESGADNFITKPFDEAYLLNRIFNIIVNAYIRGQNQGESDTEFYYAGGSYTITAERKQILDLFLSTYETAIQKNNELIEAQEEMNRINRVLEEKTIALEEEIASRKRIEEKLRTLSITDELTGLYNRRGFFMLAEQQISISKRMNKGVVMIYADLDGLKIINDTLGHNEGDRAIIQISKILRDSLRESDVTARIGGDEFVIFQMGNHEEGADIITERLQRTLEEFNLSNPDLKYKLSASIGVICYPSEAVTTIDEMMAEVDNLMYIKKKARKRG